MKSDHANEGTTFNYMHRSNSSGAKKRTEKMLEDDEFIEIGKYHSHHLQSYQYE